MQSAANFSQLYRRLQSRIGNLFRTVFFLKVDLHHCSTKAEATVESLPPPLEVLPLPEDDEEDTEWTISAVLPSSDDLRLLASIRDSSSVENKELVDASRLKRMVSKLLELLEWRSSVFIFAVELVVLVFTKQPNS